MTGHKNQYWILLVLAALLFSASCDRSAPDGVLGKVRRKNKVLFTLNGREFFPVVAYLPNLTQNPVERADINALREQGFNMVMVAIDYPWIETNKEEVDRFLRDCADAGMPVILELQEWDYWHNWLREHPEANMQLSDSKRVVTYADYANPAALAEHLRRYRAMAAFARQYASRPVAALSIGAYDYYHIPDGETHADFSVPQHYDFPQTWLPYGTEAETAYRSFLEEKGLQPAALGFEEWTSVIPPTDAQTTRTPIHWSSWNWFRKEGYVLPWLEDTAQAVREASSLPVTVSLDLRPDVWDIWATGGERWADVFDFLLVFYYGTYQEENVSARLRLLNHTSFEKETPLISFMEFSSALNTITPADVYVNASAPYVSGYLFGIDTSALRHMERLPVFLDLTGAMQADATWRQGPPKASTAVLVSGKDPMSYSEYQAAAQQLEEANVAYDAVFDLEELSSYRLVYIPANQPLLEHQMEQEQTIKSLHRRSIVVINGSLSALEEAVPAISPGKQ